MYKKRVVVTGLGMVCAIGTNVSESWDSAVNGRTGIDDVESFDTELCYSHKGGEVSITDDELCGVDYDLSYLLCIKAADEAMAEAGYSVDPENSDRTGVIMGTCVGGADSIDKYCRESDAGCEDSRDFYKMSASTIANNVALHTGANGITANIANACAAGTMSIGYAADLIREGKADVFLAGGTDAFSTLAFSGFHALHALSEDACSPLNKSNGITLGEGSAVLVIESYEHAAARGAKIYCDVLGSGVSSDAHHITAPRPDGEGQMLAIRRAMESSGIESADVDYINAHGTGTKKNDEAEFLSLHTLFDSTPDLSVSSTKSMTGHCLGAAGSIEAVLSVKALCEQEAPPTIGYSDDDLEVLKETAGDIDFIANTARKREIHKVMSNSFAFGGNNASIIFADGPGEMKDIKEKEPIYITGTGQITGSEQTETGLKATIGKDLYNKYGIKMAFYRKLDHFSQLELISGVAALDNAGITIDKGNESDIGIIIGTAEGPVGAISAYQRSINSLGIEKGSAFSFPNTVYNAAGGYLSIFTGIKGYNATNANGVQAGLQSICHAADVLKGGYEHIMLASGIDENCDFSYDLYESNGLIKGNTEPGEGAVTLVLETRSSAAQRGAAPLAELAGYGQAHEASEYFDPAVPKKALRNAVCSALADAGITAADVDIVIGQSSD